MPVLLFTLTSAAVSRLHDILVCLAKFNEDVSLEATASELRISSLNTSRTAHASFSLIGNQFFDKYHFSPDQRATPAASKAWACKLQNRALSSVFLRKTLSNKDNDTSLEKCEFELQARADQVECRLVFRLICRTGIVKTYRLTYESGEVMHATFDKSSSRNVWTVSAKTLGDVVEYFGPKTEQLDWYLQDGKVTFTSYTEKIQSGREILKQPMHTSVALEQQDFDECKLEPGLHIGIVVKDFRAIVAHAESLHVNLTSKYSRGNRPMQISYGQAGMLSEFTLMTRGLSNAPANTLSTPARDPSVRPVSQREGSRQSSAAPAAQPLTDMPPPEQRNSLKRQLSNSGERPAKSQSPPPPTASINPDSLFIPADDDDQQWDEPNYEDDTDVVTWDNATEPADQESSRRRIRDAVRPSVDEDRPPANVSEIAPTQRLSQVKGMFD